MKLVIVGANLEGPIQQRIVPIIKSMKEVSFDLMGPIGRVDVKSKLIEMASNYLRVNNIVNIDKSGSKKTSIYLLPIVMLQNFFKILKVDSSKYDKIIVFKPTIIILHALILKSLISKDFRKRLTTDIDDYESAFLFNSKFLQNTYDFYEGLLIRLSNIITTNTDFTLNRISKYNSNVKKVPNLIYTKSTRTQVSKFDSGDFKLVYYGSLNGKSGHDIFQLIDALELLFIENPKLSFQLDIYGKSSNLSEFQMRLSNYKVDQFINYYGFIDHEVLMEKLKNYDLSFEPCQDSLVNRARYPLKIVEAHYNGLPIIAFDIGDRCTIVSSEFLIKPPTRKEDYSPLIKEKLLQVMLQPKAYSGIILKYPSTTEYSNTINNVY